MGELIRNFSLPPYIWIGLGVVLTLLITHAGFRGQADSLFARMLGMKPKKRAQQHDEEEDD
jgi:hypothetical protein